MLDPHGARRGHVIGAGNVRVMSFVDRSMSFVDSERPLSASPGGAQRMWSPHIPF